MFKKIKKEIKEQIAEHMNNQDMHDASSMIENNKAIKNLEKIEQIIKDEEKASKFQSAGMSGKDWNQMNRIMQKANMQQLDYIKKFAETYIEERKK